MNYYLTYDFKLIFCKNIFFATTAKELDLQDLKFKMTETTTEILKTSYNLSSNDVNLIVKTILLGQISYLPTEQNLNWLFEFEKAIKINKDLLNDDRLTFNYLILKYCLIGFNRDKALDIVKNYFRTKENGTQQIPIEKVIFNLNEYIELKKLWIFQDLKKYDDLEKDFMTKILKEKRRLGLEFDFQFYSKEYLNICKESFSFITFELNSKQNYLIKTPLELSDMESNLLKFYEMRIKKLLTEIVETSFVSFKKEKSFLLKLVNEMKETLALSMTDWNRYN